MYASLLDQEFLDEDFSDRLGAPEWHAQEGLNIHYITAQEKEDTPETQDCSCL